MDFENILLSKFELKIMKVLNTYHFANTYELRGYFKFPAIDKILTAIQNLEKDGLIFLNETKSYCLTTTGKNFLSFRRKQTIIKIFKLIGYLVGLIGGIFTILSFLQNLK